MNLSLQVDGAFTIAADVLLLLAGLALIVKGGDLFVDGSITIARCLKVPEIIIGATIVSVGTTLPELITSVTSVVKGVVSGDAALAAGYDSIAVGNAVGSVMCNTGLILGTVLAVRPPRTDGGFAVKGIFLLCSLTVLCFFCATGAEIALWEGVVLLAFFVAFVGLNLYEASYSRRTPFVGTVEKPADAPPLKLTRVKKAKTAFSFVAGASGIALGAMLLVDNAQSICVGVGVPQQIVGITVVAIGTSLPELVTSLTALKKGTADIGLGNVIGADIINATLIIGLGACITGGLGVDPVTGNVAVRVMLAICALLVIPSVFAKRTYRVQGAAMLVLYLGFIVYNIAVLVL